MNSHVLQGFNATTPAAHDTLAQLVRLSATGPLSGRVRSMLETALAYEQEAREVRDEQARELVAGFKRRRAFQHWIGERPL